MITVYLFAEVYQCIQAYSGLLSLKRIPLGNFTLKVRYGRSPMSILIALTALTLSVLVHVFWKFYRSEEKEQRHQEWWGLCSQQFHGESNLPVWFQLEIFVAYGALSLSTCSLSISDAVSIQSRCSPCLVAFLVVKVLSSGGGFRWSTIRALRDSLLRGADVAALAI